MKHSLKNTPKKPKRPKRYEDVLPSTDFRLKGCWVCSQCHNMVGSGWDNCVKCGQRLKRRCESITVRFSINPNIKTRIVCKDCLAEWTVLVRPSNMFIQQTFDSFVQRKSRLWDININGEENSEGILQNIDKNHLK